MLSIDFSQVGHKKSVLLPSFAVVRINILNPLFQPVFGQLLSIGFAMVDIVGVF